jgi:hypothetical protein
VFASFCPGVKAHRETAYKPITAEFQICSETISQRDCQLVRADAISSLFILLLLGRNLKGTSSPGVFACRMERNHFYRKLSGNAP